MMHKLIAVTLIHVFALSACTARLSTPPVGFESVTRETPFTTETATASLSGTGGQVHVDCTNALSDGKVINTAIQGSAVGDEIIISGQCLIDQTIKLLGDRSYRGTSRTGTILKQADGSNLPALMASDTYLENLEWTGTPVSIRHMTLDGNSEMNAGGPTDGIIIRSWLSVIEDMYITNMSQDGIRVAYKSANGTDLSTSQVNGRISGSMINASGRHGISVDPLVTDWNLLDNWIGFSGADGLHLENAAGWVIERNHIYGVPHNAIHAEHLFGTSISSNLIEGFGETTETGNWYGIYATVDGGTASTISNNRIFNISGNLNGLMSPNSTYYYLALTVNYETGVVSVNGNTIRGKGGSNEIGLYYTGGGHQLNVTSTGNAVVDMGGGILIDSRVILSGGE